MYLSAASNMGMDVHSPLQERVGGCEASRSQEARAGLEPNAPVPARRMWIPRTMGFWLTLYGRRCLACLRLQPPPGFAARPVKDAKRHMRNLTRLLQVDAVRPCQGPGIKLMNCEPSRRNSGSSAPWHISLPFPAKNNLRPLLASATLSLVFLSLRSPNLHLAACRCARIYSRPETPDLAYIHVHICTATIISASS